jgi:DNA repair protein RecO (recombination protein O)
LHSRPYRETSVLLDLLSEEEGRVRCVMRGVRGDGKRARQWRGVVQPFVPLQGSWSGRHELGTVRQLEVDGMVNALHGTALYCGLYVNELLSRVLYPGEPVPGLLAMYARLLERLSAVGHDALEPVLRAFELDLLDALGLCPDFTSDAFSGAALQQHEHYRYLPESGFVTVMAGDPGLSGGVLLAMARREFDDPAVRRSAKRLTRLLLAPLLGDKPLASRALFESPASL